MKNKALSRIQKMKPYSPPLNGRRKFAGLLLDFNERTMEPSSKVKDAIKNYLEGDKLQLYPEYGELEEKLSDYIGIKEDLLITNGADQAIDLVFRTFTTSQDTVIIPTPSFAMFSQSAKTVGNRIISPFYKKPDLSFPLKEVLDSISDAIKLIVICNPNNPTGTLVPLSDIEKIARKAKNAVIMIDEAYGEFTNQSATILISRCPNIIVVRTFSKAFGLASVRIGYIIATKIITKELLKVRGPYDMNMFGYVAACAALDDLTDMKKYVKEVMERAKPLIEKFFTQNKIFFYKSSANFILFKPDNSKRVEEILRANGILVRSQKKPGIENCLRVSIGTVEQMRKFIKIYKDFIIKKGAAQNNKYAFLDRDGTLIFEPQDTFQIDSIKKLKILEGVIDGLKKLTNEGYKLIMISNQDGLGTASFPKADFDAPQNKMINIFKTEGIKFDNIFVCPHLPADNCDCRKPKIGMIKNFLKSTNIDKKVSFVCGDRAGDKAFAERIGINFVSMDTNGNFYKTLTRNGVIL